MACWAKCYSIMDERATSYVVPMHLLCGNTGGIHMHCCGERGGLMGLEDRVFFLFPIVSRTRRQKQVLDLVTGRLGMTSELVPISHMPREVPSRRRYFCAAIRIKQDEM